MANIRIRFKITSSDLEASCSCDCQKWIRNLAAKQVKTDDLQALFAGKFPSGKMFVLDMIEFLRKSDGQLHHFLIGRGGIHHDDHLTIDFDGVRQLLRQEFPELVEQFAAAGSVKKVVKRRTGAVDLAPLAALGNKS
jgi:hypothetical protein